MKIKKGQTVLIISGKDRGKKGKILQVFPKENKVVVEGVNLRKKHRKPKKSGEKGQVVLLAGSISASNIKLICSKCVKAVRVGHKIIGNKKLKICKKCKQEL